MLMHNRTVIRRLAVLPACFAVLLALLMAPYQHVHLAPSHEADDDHDDSAVVHVHPYAESASITENQGTSVERTHANHVAVSLDTFTSVPRAILLLVYQPEPTIASFVPARVFATVEIVQPCGHDPPCLESSSPRAPPA
jgi:hypothetical protein